MGALEAFRALPPSCGSIRMPMKPLISIPPFSKTPAAEYRSPEDSTVPKGSILTIAFELDGQKFTALNGGPIFKFTEAISFVVRCDSQQEIDHYWSRLSADPSGGQCGWTKDKFGLSWQIEPAKISELLKHPKAREAMLKMKKLDIAELERAGKG